MMSHLVFSDKVCVCILNVHFIRYIHSVEVGHRSPNLYELKECAPVGYAVQNYLNWDISHDLISVNMNHTIISDALMEADTHAISLHLHKDNKVLLNRGAQTLRSMAPLCIVFLVFKVFMSKFKFVSFRATALLSAALFYCTLLYCTVPCSTVLYCNLLSSTK